MEEIAIRFLSDLVGRLSGPLTLRLFLQPGVAAAFAIRDGVKDAQEGRPPHFWRMLTGSEEVRKRRLGETWRAVLKVFIMAVVLDCVYQVLVFRWVYPLEAMVTAVILAIVPYVAVRGIVTRIARRWIRPIGASVALVALALAAGCSRSQPLSPEAARAKGGAKVTERSVARITMAQPGTEAR